MAQEPTKDYRRALSGPQSPCALVSVTGSEQGHYKKSLLTKIGPQGLKTLKLILIGHSTGISAEH